MSAPVAVAQLAAAKGKSGARNGIRTWQKDSELTFRIFLNLDDRIVSMKVVAIYRPNSEHARVVEDYARDFEHQRGKTIELISLDTVQGSEMGNLYGIMEFPALLAIQDNGQLSKFWQGTQMPLMDEVAGYLEA